MTEAETKQIAGEIEEAMLGRKFGKIFPLSERSFAVDFYPHSGNYLFIDSTAKSGSVFLIVRKLKELERSKVHSGAFIIHLRKVLTGRELTAVAARDGSIWLDLLDIDGVLLRLILQLRCKPNIFLVNEDESILDAAHKSDLKGQKAGEIYAGPFETVENVVDSQDLNGSSLSAKLDAHRRLEDAETRFSALAKAARKTIRTEITKRQRLIANLDGDLAEHGNADQWKMFGDLILANISTLRRDGDTIRLTDFFDPEMRELAIPADNNLATSEVAERYFRKYIKARNAVLAISERKKTVVADIEQLQRRQDEIESAIAMRDEAKLAEFVRVKSPEVQVSKETKKASDFTGARKFRSSDGFELLVGKKAKDNDHLTFRIAKSHDTWLHAADYPGSHVIIRNPNRKEVPGTTLIEAARLAAFYSDAREKPKVAVNYTQKKFVNKPKRAAAGLASLSSFKTILVGSGFPDAVEKI